MKKDDQILSDVQLEDSVENNTNDVIDGNGVITRPKKKSVFRNFWNKLAAGASKPANVILVIAAILLTALVLVPVGFLLFNTFQIHLGETHLGTYGSLTLEHWTRLLFRTENDWAMTMFWRPLLNSVGMALLACSIAILSGGGIAFLVTRTNLPFKKFISLVFIFPYIMPSWSIAMFWENFFVNSNVSVFNRVGLLQGVTGIMAPSWFTYGFLPSAICLGIHYAPFAYILIGGILRNMDANLEEAATILKANRLKILGKITLPIVLPALISTFLLVFASSISSYTVPFILGTPVKYNTLATSMRTLVQATAYVGQGNVMAVILMLFSVVILLINQFATGKRKSFTTVSGKSSQTSLINMRWAKWVVATVVLLYVLFFAIFPLFTFALESFLLTPGDYSTFSTYYWITSDQTSPYVKNSMGIFANPEIWQAYGISLAVSITVALFAGTFGIFLGYAIARTRGRKLSNFVSMVSFFPYLIPAMSFSVIYLVIATQPGFAWLYESIPLLMLVGSVKFLPFATRSGTGAMMQISPEIEEAAVLVGVSWPKRMARILFPIQKTSIISGYLLPFISTMRELTLFVLIAPMGTILTQVLNEYMRNDMTQITNGVNLIIIATVLLINFSINKITGASIDKGVGGN